MAKRLQEYVKYTTQELDLYSETEGSCVRKINTNLHLSMGPFSLADFKHILMAHLVRSKIGFYDMHLEGIVLDIKKVKVLGTTAEMRADDPRLHININADVYVFKPEEGAELTGLVRHIGPHQVGVILYRVFSANLRVAHKVDKDEVQMEQEVKFRVRKFNLQNVFPYIDGELLTPGAENALLNRKKTKFSTEHSDNGDSGIEEKDGLQELDALLSIIKTEATSELEGSIKESKKKKSKKSTETLKDFAVFDTSAEMNTPSKKSEKRKSFVNNEDYSEQGIEEKDGLQELDALLSIIKTEATSELEDSINGSKKKKSKKSKKSTETLEDFAVFDTIAEMNTLSKKSEKLESFVDNEEYSEQLVPSTPKKIKKELTFSDDSAPSSSKKRKKETTTFIKKRKCKTNSFSELEVSIKQEVNEYD